MQENPGEVVHREWRILLIEVRRLNVEFVPPAKEQGAEQRLGVIGQ